MANDFLKTFVDQLAEEYKRMEQAQQDKRFCPPYIYLDILTKFYETVLKRPKHKTQAYYCKEVIKQLNPGFYKGYFESRKTQKS